MFEYIHVDYKIYNTDFTIKKALETLNTRDIVSFDLETQSLYSKENKKEAKTLLKEGVSTQYIKLCKLVARSSGLSNPRLIRCTHFIFGISRSESIIMISRSRKTEEMIFNWLAEFKGKVLVWNSLFDLKIMYERVKKLPKDYEDPMLLLKSLINDVDNWQSKVGLKDFAGAWYDPKWALDTNYDNEDLKDEDFLRYCSIDGAATYYSYEIIQERIK